MFKIKYSQPEAGQPTADAVLKSLMFYTYVLKSLKNNKRYIGQTSKDVLNRLREHNVGSNKWTRVNSPFILLHYEGWNTRTEAIKREHFLKSG